MKKTAVGLTIGLLIGQALPVAHGEEPNPLEQRVAALEAALRSSDARVTATEATSAEWVGRLPSLEKFHELRKRMVARGFTAGSPHSQLVSQFVDALLTTQGMIYQAHGRLDSLRARQSPRSGDDLAMLLRERADLDIAMTVLRERAEMEAVLAK